MAKRRREAGYDIVKRRHEALVKTMSRTELLEKARTDPSILRDPAVQDRISDSQGGSRV